MAKIHNPQNEKGETLATNNEVANVKNGLMDQISNLISRIESLENGQINPPSEPSIPPTITTNLEFSDLDDTTGIPLNTFADLSKINFRGKYVNISSEKDNEITIYINEDNSLNGWDGNIIMLPKSGEHYIYGVPENSNRIGNTKYTDVATTGGIHNLIFNYNDKPFSLPKSDYTFVISYKVNNVEQPIISIPLKDYISANKPQLSENFNIDDKNLIINGKKLGNEVLSEGKMPGSLEITNFNYVLQSSYLSEGLISDIKVSFIHDTASNYEIIDPKNIYLWTSIGDSSDASGEIILTPNFNNYVKVSGLQYIDSENEDNSVSMSLSASNLANGALISNIITLTQNGFTVKDLSNKTLTDTNKAYSYAYNDTLHINKQNTVDKLTISAHIPNPSGVDTLISANTDQYPFYSASLKQSTELIENFYSENKRLTAEWNMWNSNTQLSSGEAVVQYGNLFHTNTTSSKWKDAGANDTLKNYKNLNKTNCNFYRIFKESNNKSTTNTFYIDCATNLLGNEDKIEIIVQPHNGTSWNTNKYVANKISTPTNDGLASSSLVNGKIKCDLPIGNGTYCAEGLRVEIIIKDPSITLSPITISFN